MNGREIRRRVNWRLVMWQLVNPPERGGMGMNPEAAAGLTMFQAAVLMAEDKKLRQTRLPGRSGKTNRESSGVGGSDVESAKPSGRDLRPKKPPEQAQIIEPKKGRDLRPKEIREAEAAAKRIDDAKRAEQRAAMRQQRRERRNR